MEIPRSLASILSLGSTSSQNKGQQPIQHLQLPLGQLLKATVVEAFKGQQFTLDINGHQFNVETRTPLALGQHLQLQVMRTEPQVELQIVNTTINAFVGKSLPLTGQNLDLAPLFQTLSQGTSVNLLDSISTASRSILENFISLQSANIDTPSAGNTVKQLFENIGFQFEKNLAAGDKNGAAQTLKAALLEIAQVFKDSEPIYTSAQKLLSTIELFQVAQLQTSSNDFIIFPLPFPFLEAGYLQIDRDTDDRGDKDNDHYRFSVHLSMSELGDLNIDFIKSKTSVLIRILVDSEEKSAFIKENIDDLSRVLSTRSQVSIHVGVGAVAPVQKLLKLIVADGESMLDTRV